jgi:hypothetical protein
MSTKAILIVAFALSTAITSSAPAQTRSRGYTYDPNTGTYVQRQPRAYSGYRNRSPYYDYNLSPYYGSRGGRYWGTDPDPFIQDQRGRCREC